MLAVGVKAVGYLYQARFWAILGLGRYVQHKYTEVLPRCKARFLMNEWDRDTIITAGSLLPVCCALRACLIDLRLKLIRPQLPLI